MDGTALPLNPAVRIGRWWFRWRSFSPLPLFVLMVALPPEVSLSASALMLALSGIACAEGLRIWAVGLAGSATRTRGDTVPELVHAGPYRYVRNPLYVANIALYTLCSVVFGQVLLSVAIALFSITEYCFIVIYEESVLRQTFGATYEDYCRAVPRWLPSFFPRYPASRHAFDLKRALRSERSTLFSMAVVCLLFFLRRLF
jgi:protein-S-isoprenylcysteine O-methyltransferase Ste14